jgi:hypothetical protein
MANVEMKAVVKIFGATAAQLSTENIVLPKDMMVYETDTNRIKIGNGVTNWNTLEYVVKNPLSDAEYAMIQNAGAANGFALLDDNGIIPLEQLPQVAKSHIVYKADIAARDAIPEASRTAMVVVLDASADATVTGGYAVYAWDANNTTWIKISEGESLDVDFSVFFNHTTMTLDDITDGTTYVKMTVEERALIANAVQKTDVLILSSASSIAELQTLIA